MATEYSTVIRHLWNYCHVLSDDGWSYGDYVEQLSDLLFLKMDDENLQVNLCRDAPLGRLYLKSMVTTYIGTSSLCSGSGFYEWTGSASTMNIMDSYYYAR